MRRLALLSVVRNTVLAECFGTLFAHGHRSGLPIAGWPLARYVAMGPGLWTVEAAMPLASPVTAAGDMQPGNRPAGPAASQSMRVPTNDSPKRTRPSSVGSTSMATESGARPGSRTLPIRRNIRTPRTGAPKSTGRWPHDCQPVACTLTAFAQRMASGPPVASILDLFYTEARIHKVVTAARLPCNPTPTQPIAIRWAVLTVTALLASGR
jgi:hypothetical protein